MSVNFIQINKGKESLALLFKAWVTGHQVAYCPLPDLIADNPLR